MQQFKKGDKVYEVCKWDTRGTFFIRVLEIQSWGKKQATATTFEDGKFIKCSICTNIEPEVYHSHYFPITTPNIEEVALDLAAKYMERELRFLNGCIERHSHDKHYVAAIQRDIEKLLPAPKVIYL